MTMTIEATKMEPKPIELGDWPFERIEASPVRVGVVGAGKISEEHLKFLQARTDVEIVGIADLSPALVKYAVNRFGAKRAFNDYRAMLEETSPHVVHVLTPPFTHGSIVRDCLEANAHVIVEKPIAPTRDEFHQMVQTARNQKRLLIEDHNYRFNRPILTIDTLIEEGKLGEIVDVEVFMCMNIRSPQNRYGDPNLPHPSHRMPCGALHEFITHLTYLVLHYMPDADRVAAAWSNRGGGDLFKYDDLDAVVIGGDRHARIRFSTTVQPDAFRVIVRGTEGWAETDFFQPYLRVVRQRGGGHLVPFMNHAGNGLHFIRAAFSNFMDKVLQRSAYEGLHGFLDRTYASLTKPIDPPVRFDDMDRALALIDALVAEHNQV